MLQPLKPTKATEATESTSSTDALTPISETRPGNTLQDRLYRKPEITGGGKLPEEKGNKKSLFQEYSIAKFLPATPVAPAASTANFQATMGKFGTFEDFWSNLTKTSKTPEQPMVYQHKGGIGQWFTQEEADLRDKYMGFGQDAMEKMVKSQLDVNKRVKNRFYEDLTKEYDTYSKQDPIYQVLGAGSGGTLNALTNEETKAITDLAKREGLGQRGYEALLDQAYTAKSMYHAKSNVEGLVKALEKPDDANWESLSKSLGVEPSMSMGEIMGTSASDIGGGGVIEGGISASLLKAFKFAKISPAAIGVGMALSFLSGAYSDIADKTMEHARFNPIKGGKLAKTIGEFSGSEKRNIEELADRAGVSPDDMVQAMGSIFQSKLAKIAQYQAKDYDTLQGFIASDNRIGYGVDSLKQTQQYVKGQGDLGYYSPEYWGSYKEMFKGRNNV